MEKVLNFLRDGENKLPPGFRFQPTDEEIVFGYLARKVFNYPLPSSIIPETNIFRLDPLELPGDSDQDRYFFTNKQAKYPNRTRTSISTCGGYWKPTGSDKYIVRSKKVPVIGIKKTLVFYRKSHRHEASKTNWTMHLYCIAIPGNSSRINQHKKNSRGCLILGNWVLGHVFLKKKSTTKADRVAYDSMVGDVISDMDSSSVSSDTCSYPDSSALSEVSSSSVETSGENV